MVVPSRPSSSRAGLILGFGTAAAVVTAGVGLVLVSLLISPEPPAASCSMTGGEPGSIVLLAGAGGQRVGATEYGGPGDPGSGTVGASGIDLPAHPDSYAELGGTTFPTASAMGGLPYMTPLRISWGPRSAIAYKRDFGLGGGPVNGLLRVIDLWWQFAGALGIPYQGGRWSGAVQVSLPPAAGAGSLLGGSPSAPPGGGLAGPAGAAAGGAAATTGTAGTADTAACGSSGARGVQMTAGERAELLPDGQAAAPANAPAVVQAIIAAGNQIVGKPYVYGGAHGLPLDQIAPAYDCSSSVEHLLYGGGLLPVGYGAASGALESFGRPGPGRWVTIYASVDHVFMYVAGLRWDTYDAAGPGDGSAGIGWHPLVRSSAGFIARHPAGF
ncbi:MAG TPA: hypothetical protein VG365_16680 [Solirubrobacteraceae bacterium]|nr:hypothetical protein [Solirubrobacteraceae bacterium]